MNKFLDDPLKFMTETMTAQDLNMLRDAAADLYEKANMTDEKSFQTLKSVGSLDYPQLVKDGKVTLA